MPDLAPIKRRELNPQTYIPYVRHVDAETVALTDRGLLQMIALEGVPFETADGEDLNALHRTINTLLRNVADQRLGLWSHVVRRRETDYPDGVFASPFARSLDARYRARMIGTDLYRNDLVLSVVWLPERDPAEKVTQLFARLRRARGSGVELDPEALKKLSDAVTTLVAGLQPFTPKILGLVERDGLLFSEPAAILHQLVGGRYEPVPLTDGTVASAVYSDRVIFGRETVEIRHEGESRFAGALSFKEYPARTRAGMLDGLLGLPFEFILSQSFVCLAKPDAKAVMARKQNQMLSAGDRAASQIEELDSGLDDLESNRFVLGEHHLTLLVFAPDPRLLRDRLARARATLTNGGAVVAREDLGLEAAFWAQLPGNTRFRARSGAITSKNFAALSPFRGYPTGKKDGNAWGAAVALLTTASGSPYYFNFHHGDLGNTFVCGPSGSGKTVILNFMLAQLQKHGPRLVFFDKDRGAELFVRAIAGTYLALTNGVPTGCAPLKALELTPANKLFLARWIMALAGLDAERATVAALDDVATAIDGLADLPRESRTIGSLRAFMDTTDPEGIAARLRRWERDGPLGWAFDSDEDRIELSAAITGFDMTDFLDNPEIRSPLMQYLFHRVEQSIDGRRIAIVVDEFWKALGDEAFRDLAQNKLKTIRKQNGLVIFATQSPRDALNSPIAHTIIEQCATQIFFPNPRGQARDYVDGFKLTEAEFALISRELNPDSRRFLVKQGRASVVAELNLSGFDDELSILSGRTANIELLDSLRAEVGDDPGVWLPLFLERRRAS